MGPWARLVESISSKMAFFPPDPPSYHVVEADAGAGTGAWIKAMHIPRIPDVEVFRLPTKRRKEGGGGETVLCCYMRHRAAKLTLLYSHGNAVDLGQMQPFYRELSNHLKVNILGYDYSGYGESSGFATVNNCIADIDACYACLLEKYGTKPAQVVLYGQSVGTGPSVDLAARTPELGGLVLHSPLLSGVRVLNPTLKRWPSWADIFPNIHLMPKVKCLTTVLHGTEDEVIDITHGHKLHELAPQKAAPLWLEGYNHQNLETSPEYLPHLERFLARIEQRPALRAP
mmetsp:Transcript_46875/g.119584  ORF Transcript_46875/g.119584 Transcript_46875/m.119584 type:complete len:286 (+) Transcript_46875:487-1344(+)